jgi:hypothetical protein
MTAVFFEHDFPGIGSRTMLLNARVSKAIRQGAVVGLANHTLLIAKDGTERAIDRIIARIRSMEGWDDRTICLRRNCETQATSCAYDREPMLDK